MAALTTILRPEEHEALPAVSLGIAVERGGMITSASGL